MSLRVKSAGLLAFAALLWSAPPTPASAQPAQAHDGRAPQQAEAAAPRREGEAAPRPAIWLLADEDTRIYLFGTIHMLPPGLKWRSPAFDRVVDEVDELVMEVADEPSEEETQATAHLVLLDKPEPILSRVTPDRRKPLGELIHALGLTVDAFDSMQTWAAAMTIEVTALANAYGQGAEELTGVEDALREDFTRTGKPISGVETGAQQLGFLASLSPATQRQMLESMVDAYRGGDGAGPGGDPAEEGWLRGDTEQLGLDMSQMPPELFDALITRRNRAWTQWLIERLERPGTVLFAVGAGHLAGRDSVQSMLEARGFQVARHD